MRESPTHARGRPPGKYRPRSADAGVGRWHMPKIGEQAVVLGASMGGLLAARVLADFYDTVTLVERDVLPDGPVNRRGVPQGRHVHALLRGGAQILNELFPRLLDELVAAGAPILGGDDLANRCLSFAGHQLVGS